MNKYPTKTLPWKLLAMEADTLHGSISLAVTPVDVTHVFPFLPNYPSDGSPPTWLKDVSDTFITSPVVVGVGLPTTIPSIEKSVSVPPIFLNLPSHHSEYLRP